MVSMRDIKDRIANVSSTEQIINAMDAVASSKLHKIRAQMEGVRPLYNELKRQVEKAGSYEAAATHTFYQQRDIKSSLYVVITSDQGFAGSYNTNILKKALEHMNEGKNEKILVIGSKGRDYFRSHNKNIIREITDISDSKMYFGTEDLAKWITDIYLSEEVDEIFIAYTDFKNVMSHEARIEKMLPIVEMLSEKRESEVEQEYEQGIETFIDHVVPLYLHMNLFRAFSESHTSEQAARKVSMDAASTNAEDIIDDLKLQYNRQRQAAITQELSEIIGGSNI